MQENRNRRLIFEESDGDITYDGPNGLPVPDAIAGVDGGNDNACNPEEDYRYTDMDEDMTGYAPDPPTDNNPDLDVDTNDSDANGSDSGGPYDGDDATRANVRDSLLDSISKDITEKSERAGVRKYDDNGDDTAITGVDVKNIGVGKNTRVGTGPAQVKVEPNSKDVPDDI